MSHGQQVQCKAIQNYSYQSNDLLGTGYSSQVYKGKDDRTQEIVAIKVIDIKLLTNQVQQFLLRNEIAVMKKLHSSYNCLKLIDVFQTKNNTYIITEYCQQGDLKSLITKLHHIPELQAISILKLIVKGFKEIVGYQIIHRDIKPHNILMKDGIPKLADFGFSKDLNGEQCKIYYNVGSPMYMSLQAIKQNQHTFKSDVWSIGVTYFEMLFGCPPWKADTEQQLVQKIEQSHIYFPDNIKVSENSKDFIRQCLKIDENQRLGHLNIDLHPLLKQQINQMISPSTLMGMDKENRWMSVHQNQENAYSVKQNVKYTQMPVNQNPYLVQNREILQNKPQNVRVQSRIDDNKVVNQRTPRPEDNLSKTASIRSVSQNTRVSKTPVKPPNTPQIIHRNSTNNSNIPFMAKQDSNKDNEEYTDNYNIILSQINYCRFLVKLAKQIKEFYLFTKTDNLKEKIIFLIYKNVIVKITSLHQMCQLSKNNLNLEDFEAYQKTEYFQKFTQVINEYFKIYASIFEDNWEKMFSKNGDELSKDKNFDSIFNRSKIKENPHFYETLIIYLKQSISEMNQNLNSDILTQPDTITQQSEKKIILLDYLVTYYQLALLILEKFTNYKYFSDNSHIIQIAQGKPVKCTKLHFYQIQNKIESLEIQI